MTLYQLGGWLNLKIKKKALIFGWDFKHSINLKYFQIPILFFLPLGKFRVQNKNQLSFISDTPGLFFPAILNQQF